MKLKQRVLALIMSAVMLVTPVLAMAEDDVWAIPAGEVTTTAISDDYIGGEQINLSATLGFNTALTAEQLGEMLGMDAASAEKKLAAVQSLLEKCTVEMSFYDDFGTARIHAELLCDGMSAVEANILVFEDGSLQMMTNMTGQIVFTLPAGTIDNTVEQIDAFSLLYGDFAADVDNSVPFEELPALERLKVTGTEVLVMIMSHLLGWVSGTQMDTGELYVFDDTYLEPTETRDGVAQRMIGTIRTQDFTKFLWNIATTLRDEQGLFQQALTDVLAENGVTRTQVRKVVDSLLTEEYMDPAEDWVQPSHSIPDDGALCTLDDISYAFKKLQKSATTVWHNSYNQDMSMIVSYDDYGGMVGFDATVPLMSTCWPFEGDFAYSIKTDDNWQRIHTSHGELQVYNNHRVIGDLSIQFGEDVEGVNASHFRGNLDVVNQNDNSSMGFGVDTGVNFAAEDNEAGYQNERFDANAALLLRMNGASAPLAIATLTGETVTGEEGFAIDASAVLDIGVAALMADVTMGRAEYEDIPFAGGEAIDLSAITDKQKEKVKEQIIGNAAGMALTLAMRPGVMNDLMTIVE